MVDKIKPLKIESAAGGGTETNLFPAEADPTEDYVAGKGISFENSDSRLIDLESSNYLQGTDIRGTFRIGEALGRPWFILTYSNNGTLGNNWMGPNELVTSSRVMPVACLLVALSFGNTNAGVDVDYEVYKNGRLAGNLVYTWQVRNLQNGYVQLVTPIAYSAGDTIDVYARDQGDNGSDVVLDVTFEVTQT